MKGKITFCLVFVAIFGATNLFSQSVGIGDNNFTPDASAALEILSNDKGVLIPRLSSSERDAIASPATGLLIYQTDNIEGFYYYNGTIWVAIVDSESMGDNDASNEIQDLQLVGDILTITDNTGATEIDLSKYLDNSTLSEAEVDAFVANNGYIDTEADPVFAASVASNITAADTSRWGAAGFSGDYNDLTNQPNIADSIANLGFSGDYADLENLPTDLIKADGTIDLTADWTIANNNVSLTNGTLTASGVIVNDDITITDSLTVYGTGIFTGPVYNYSPFFGYMHLHEGSGNGIATIVNEEIAGLTSSNAMVFLPDETSDPTLVLKDDSVQVYDAQLSVYSNTITEPMAVFRSDNNDASIQVNGQDGEAYIEFINDDTDATGEGWKVGLNDDVDLEFNYGDQGTANAGVGNYNLMITNDSKEFRMDSDGFGIGVNPDEAIEVEGDDADIYLTTINSGDISSLKMRRAYDGETIVEDGRNTGKIEFEGYDGDEYVTNALIYATVEGTPGDNDMGGKIEFWTTPDDSDTPEERMTIHNDGTVTIGEYNLPATDGTDGQVLTTDGAGSVTWEDAGSGTPDYFYGYINGFTGSTAGIGTYLSNGISVSSNRIQLNADKVYMVSTTAYMYNFNDANFYRWFFYNVTGDIRVSEYAYWGSPGGGAEIKNYVTQPVIFMIHPAEDIEIDFRSTGSALTGTWIIGRITITEVASVTAPL